MRIRQLQTNLENWKFARSLSLSAIVTTGLLCTGAVAALGVAHHAPPPAHAGLVTPGYSYEGIGVEIEQRHHEVVVRRVMPNSPAAGHIHPGAILISVDGERYGDVRQWARAIRGTAGTPIDLEVAYPCRGHEEVTVERGWVHLGGR